jgi:hypothetical protein
MFKENQDLSMDNIEEYKPSYEFKEFIKPDNKDAKIWRYMNFTKFVSLLKERSLYFARSDKFEDIYEGKAPMINYDLLYKEYLDKYKEKLKSQSGAFFPCNPLLKVISFTRIFNN